ncbi:sulfatase-like hydrolase/transferase [Panacibacter ginsenosidivorans]|uniref:Sulfatase-like hydrolase/transferase n=1 Tax=Panacibacter ginsenosidivorans TaxID=1813871 RepID=A0A5B8VGX2_9BACT|nr:sulfatase-like hydrolase/transferase [Panacibacter ginsenosidivorans]QEC69558.1 sulfatase-like hydrolase/transferase [Panacibacter ginsenosidivorans]
MKKTLCNVLLLILYCSTPLFLHAQQKPNVIFIGIDDLGTVFDAYGNADVPCPNFARMAQHGTMFRRVYCQYALCSPSRASLLSGKRPNSTGVINNGTSIRTNLGADYKFLPEYFQSNGYYTGKFGKMTCGHEEEIAWNYVYDSAIGDGIQNIGGTPHWWIDTLHKSTMSNNYGLFVSSMIQKMREPRSNPYFFGLGIGVHNEFTPNLAAWNKIGDNTVQQLLPVDIDTTYTNVYGNGSANITLPNTPANDQDDIPAPALKNLQVYPTDVWKNIRHAYYGEIIQEDSLLGVVLDELDRTNAWQNTVVVFWSDHGIQTGEHNGLWFKQTLFEGALRVPMVICAPGKSKGLIHESPVELVDIYSTLSELCGLPVPAGQEGSSLVPVLEKPNIPWKKAAFAQVRRVDRQGSSDTTLSDAVRTTQYHYNSWGTAGEELYDDLNDPDEFTNLVTNAAYASVLDSMRTLLANNWQGALPPVYTKRTFYRDSDRDNYGTRLDTVIAYFAPAGYITTPGDCNDNNAKINPGAAEKSCNGIDDNCNGSVDENNPVPTVTASGSLDICTTGSVTLTTNAGKNLTYQWRKNSVNIAGATAISYTATSAGNYTVIVTNTKKNCSGTSATTKVTNSCVTGLNSAIASSVITTSPVKLSVYPNPSKGSIAVTCSSSTNTVQLKVFDITGRAVYMKQEQNGKAVNTLNLNLSNLRSGMYYLEVNDGGLKQRTMFVIAR